MHLMILASFCNMDRLRALKYCGLFPLRFLRALREIK
jgi:hypothetical protein